MNLIITIVVGGIVGWLASILMKTNRQMGILANVIVGIIGTWLGGWIAGAIGLTAYGAIARWAVAVGGAVVLIALLKGLKILR